MYLHSTGSQQTFPGSTLVDGHHFAGTPICVGITLTDGLTDEQRQRLFRWTDDVFADAGYGFVWEAKRWHALLTVHGELAGHVGIIRRIVAVNHEPVMVGGISGVLALPRFRHHGLARLGLAAAMNFVRHRFLAEAGLLLCKPELVPFYERLGWMQVEGPVLFDQPAGKVNSPLTLMALPCADRAWPVGEVDLCGLPF